LRVLYFDCFAGAAGDMILGALLDAGVPFEELKRALGSLAVEGWDVSVDRVIKTGVSATKFRVHEHAHQGSGIGDQGAGVRYARKRRSVSPVKRKKLDLPELIQRPLAQRRVERVRAYLAVAPGGGCHSIERQRRTSAGP